MKILHELGVRRYQTYKNLADMLDQNSIPEPNSGCWLWLRGVAGGKTLYPVWKWQGQRRQASHLALSLKGVAIPTGYDACHRCDNPLCVNPDHLFVGTRHDNMRDAQTKHRLVGYRKREVCKQGHLLSAENVRVNEKTGKRSCKICSRVWGRIGDAKRRPRKR